MTTAERAEIWAWLADIERGYVVLAKHHDQPEEGDYYIGVVRYTDENGQFECEVFWDCGEWDYLESITINGRRFDYGELDIIGSWRPPDDAVYKP